MMRVDNPGVCSPEVSQYPINSSCGAGIEVFEDYSSAQFDAKTQRSAWIVLHPSSIRGLGFGTGLYLVMKRVFSWWFRRLHFLLGKSTWKKKVITPSPKWWVMVLRKNAIGRARKTNLQRHNGFPKSVDRRTRWLTTTWDTCKYALPLQWWI